MSEWHSGSERFERFWAAGVMGTAVDDVVREFVTAHKRLAYMIWQDGYVRGYGALLDKGATPPDLQEGLSVLMRAIRTMPIPAKDGIHRSVDTEHEFVDRQGAWYREMFLPAMERLQGLVPAEPVQNTKENHT